MEALELATNEELIAELMRRQTFVGVIIYSNSPHKIPNQVHDDFEVVSRCDSPTTVYLLSKIAEIIQQG